VGVRLVGSQDRLHLLKQICLHDRGVFTGIGLVLVNDLADVFFVGQQIVDSPSLPRFAAKVFAGLGAILLRDNAFGVECLGHLSAGFQFQKHLKHPANQLGFGAIDDVFSVNNIEPENRLTTDVFALPGGRQFFVADAFADDLPLELGE